MMVFKFNTSLCSLAGLLCCLLVFCGTSLLGQISTFPHVSSFEDEGQCITGCNTNCQLQGTWQNQYTEDEDWLVDRSGTPSQPTGPSQDHTFGTSQGYYIYTEASSNNCGYPNKRSDLESAYFDFTSLNDTLYLSYWYHMYGVHMGLLHMDVDTSGGTSPWILDFVPAITDNTNQWQRRLISLEDFMGLDSVRFRFRAVSGTNYAGDMALDDIDFFIPVEEDLEVTAIPEPLSSCTLSDTETVEVTLFNHGTRDWLPGETIDLCYQIDQNPPVNETFTLTDTLFASGALGLVFQQQADLSAKGPYTISSWSKMSPLGTSHNRIKTVELYHYESVNQFPYEQGFEAGQGLWQIDGANNSWAVGTPTKPVINGAANGVNAMSTGIGTSQHNIAERGFVLSPCFDLTGICRPTLRLNVAWECESTWDGAVIQYSTNGGQSWVRAGNNGDPDNWYNSADIYSRPGGQSHGWTGTVASGDGSGGWVSAKRNLYNLANRNVLFRVAFYSDNGVNFDGFAFDDFVISNGVYLGQDFSICIGDTAVLDADFVSGDNYLWSTGATTQTLEVTQPGVYWVEVTNNAYCTTRDTIEVFGVATNYAVNLGADTAACGEYTLNAGFVPGFSYLWSNGQTGQAATVSTSGAFYVDVTTPCGTVRSDTQNITILPVPDIEIGADTTICDSIALMAGPSAANWTWSTGATGQFIVVNSSGNYSVTATNSDGCSASDTIDIAVAGLPDANLGPDTTFCVGDTLCLVANPDSNLAYTWTTGAVGNGICVTTGGVYAVTVTNQDNCVNSDTVIATIPADPIANIAADTSNCPTITFFGNSTGGPVDTWQWLFGDGNSSNNQNPSNLYPGQGLYTVELIAANACATDTAEFQIPVVCEVSIEEELARQVEIFPQPVEDILYLRFLNPGFSQLEIRMLDLLGKQVQPTRTFRVLGNGQVEWNVEGLPTGLYILEMETRKGIARKRVVVQ